MCESEGSGGGAAMGGGPAGGGGTALGGSGDIGWFGVDANNSGAGKSWDRTGFAEL